MRLPSRDTWFFIVQVLANLIAVVGIIGAALLYTEQWDDKVMALIPSHRQAVQGATQLEDLSLSVKDAVTATMPAQVLGIDEEPWGVFFSFVQTETAVAKSPRAERFRVHKARLASSRPDGDDVQPPELSLSAADWARIKTIVALERPVVRAGPKALVAPYLLVVYGPGRPPVIVYEFLSFQELRNDLYMFVSKKVQFWLMLAGAVALLLEISLYTVMWALAKWFRHQSAIPPSATAVEQVQSS